MTVTDNDGALTKEEWALREKFNFVIKVSETDGKIEEKLGIAEYDHTTAGKNVWRMAKEVTSLGKEFESVVKKKGEQRGAKQLLNPEDNDREFARIFTEIHDNHKDRLSTSTWDLGEFMKAVKNKGRQAANAFRKSEMIKPGRKLMEKVKPQLRQCTSTSREE